MNTGINLIFGKCVVCGGSAMQVDAFFSPEPECDNWCCVNRECAASWNVRDGDIEMNLFNVEDGLLFVFNHQEIPE